MKDQSLTPEQQRRQHYYRDARFTDSYDQIWQSVGKCVFCDLRDKYVFYEENGIVMTISLYAYIDGHFMIVPRRHIRSPRQLTQTEWATVRKFLYIAKKLVKRVHGITGMQLVEKDGAEAQSTVNEHLHFHVIPFDAPDLCTWNYRQLKHTPLENVALYKRARKQIAEYGNRFEQKYVQPQALPVVCDLLAVNTRGELLLQRRQKKHALSPDYLTPPGGHVDNFSVPFETELAREVLEETGLSITPDSVRLLLSRPSQLRYNRYSPHLKLRYPQPHRFIWNTYFITGVPTNAPLTPQDDCAELLWLPLDALDQDDRISPEIRQAVDRLKHVL